MLEISIISVKVSVSILNLNTVSTKLGVSIIFFHKRSLMRKA